MDADCPAFLKPRLRLFLSADIVGSTALKQSRFEAQLDNPAQNLGSWFFTIQGFYIEAKQSFFEIWNERHSGNPDPPEVFGPAPAVWKTVGDEILFVKELTDYRQVATFINCWIQCLPKIRAFLRKCDSRLDVKCTSWTAGFPLHNKEVVVSGVEYIPAQVVGDYFLSSGILLNKYYEEGDRSGVIVDFIGPSIDTGFRLAQLSTARKFVVSLDVGYIVSLTMPLPSDFSGKVALYYDGLELLKGVFGGRRYPVFWTDIGEGPIHGLEDKLTAAAPCNRDSVLDFCREYFSQNEHYIFLPFIASASEQHLIIKPSKYVEAHANMVKSFSVAQSSWQEPSNNGSNTQSPELDEATRKVTFSSLEEEIKKFLVKEKNS